jgi:hypothetical protein
MFIEYNEKPFSNYELLEKAHQNLAQPFERLTYTILEARPNTFFPTAPPSSNADATGANSGPPKRATGAAAIAISDALRPIRDMV